MTMRIEANWERLNEEERALARHMLDTGDPVGAAKAHRHLSELGFSVSQATVSRSLLRLDETGFTTSVGRAGRTLSDQGRALLERSRQRARRNALVEGLLDGADRTTLIDLLGLRRQIELEAVGIVVERAGAAELEAIEASVRAYEEHRVGGDFSRDAIDFHVLLCRATTSTPYELIAEALLPEIGRLEPILVRAAELAHEESTSNAQHAAIAEALRRRDASTARSLLAAHFDVMLEWLDGIDDEEIAALLAGLETPRR